MHRFYASLETMWLERGQKEVKKKEGERDKKEKVICIFRFTTETERERETERRGWWEEAENTPDHICVSRNQLQEAYVPFLMAIEIKTLTFFSDSSVINVTSVIGCWFWLTAKLTGVFVKTKLKWKHVVSLFYQTFIQLLNWLTNPFLFVDTTPKDNLWHITEALGSKGDNKFC